MDMLHHPSTHSDNDTDPKHNKTRQLRAQLDQYRNCLFRFSACLWMRSVDSLLVNKRMGRGSSWSSLDLETLESDVSSGKSAGAIAKDRGWPSSSVCQRVAAIKRRDPAPRYVGGVEMRLTPDLAPRYVGGVERPLTPELLDEIREFIDEECGRISVKIVSNRFTLSRSSSRSSSRASVGDPYRAPSGGPSHP